MHTGGSPARVLLLGHNFPLHPDDEREGGIFAADLARGLAARGHEVRVVAPEDDGVQEAIAGVDVVRFDWRGTGKRLGQMDLSRPGDLLSLVDYVLNGRKELDRQVHLWHPEAVIALWLAPSGLFALWARVRFGLPYMVWAFGADVDDLPSFTRPLLRAVASFADRCVADGAELAERVEELGASRCIPVVVPTIVERGESASIERVLDEVESWLGSVGRG